MNSAAQRLAALACGRFELTLDRVRVMGVVNVTPDSFSDGGRFASPAAAIEHGLRLIEDGADLLDIGGESTRPGARAVDAEDEWRRVAPVLEGLRGAGVPLSLDTRKPEVIRRAIDLGVDMINDVSGFATDDALAAVAGAPAALCVMHMRGEPFTMQCEPAYRDVTDEVFAYLYARLEALQAVGVARSRVVLDPGIGFGKTIEHNVTLIRRLPRLVALGQPVLIGLSRKSLIGALTGGTRVADRLAGSIAGALASAAHGARIVRVHDVRETVQALAVWRALADEESDGIGDGGRN